MLDLVISFLFGVVGTLSVVALAILVWYNAHPTVSITGPHITKNFEPFVRPRLPQHLEEVFNELNGPDGTGVQFETCNWFNLIVDFLFRELRDSTLVKRIIMKKINTEFEELMLTKTEGKMIEQLTVRDYFLGTSVPVINDVTIVRIECSPDNDKEPMLIEVAMNVDYGGGGEVKIDADLVFNKAAYVAVKICRVKGRVRLRFSTLPYTHWSFSFYEEPEIDMKVDSHFEGRTFPQLSSFIETQLQKFVRKKYTLPACKARHKPFFRKTKPQDQLLEIYVKDSKLTVGELLVEVMDCSRLLNVDVATKHYCTVSVASTPYKPRVNLWRTQWPAHEILVPKGSSQQKIGFRYKMVTHEDKLDRSQLVVVSIVVPESEAETAGILVGDVLSRINNVKITSVKQVERIIQKSKGASVLLTVQRPPAHFKHHVLTNREPLATAQQGFTNSRPHDYTYVHNSEPLEEIPPCQDVTEAHQSADDEGLVPARSFDADSISLCGVGGERGRENHSHNENRPLQWIKRNTDEMQPDELIGLFTLESAAAIQNSTMTSRSRLSSTLLSGELSSVRLPQTVLHQQISEREERGSIDPSSSTSNGVGAVVDDCASSSEQQVTREVEASKNPCWNELFTFKVDKEHHYLNVCIWNKLSDETGDLLIGHVTIPLMDIALECLSTSSGYHHQRYVLVAAQTVKPSASRAALQASSSTATFYALNKKSKDFAGDICLRFKHLPDLCASSDQDQLNSELPTLSNEDTLPTDPQNVGGSHCPSLLSEETLPSNHTFVEVVRKEGRLLCDICNKKIWTLKSRPYKCHNCGLKCHKKCADYCLKEVPCRQSQQAEQTRSRLSDEADNSDKDHDNGHRLLQQQSLTPDVPKNSISNSFELLEASDSSLSSGEEISYMSQEIAASKCSENLLSDSCEFVDWEVFSNIKSESGSEEMCSMPLSDNSFQRLQ